jgi:uncharacterized HAD superfamily protein
MKCSHCSREVRPVVAVDIDGTLAKYHETVREFSQMYFDYRLPHSEDYDGSVDFEVYLGLSQAEYRAMKLAFRQGGNKRFLPAYPRASSLVDEMRHAGAEIWVATTRPWDRLDNVDPDTREWLRRNEIVIDGLLYGEDKYHQLVEAVERERIVAVFDDLAKQIDVARDLGLPAFQVHRPHNSAISERRSPGGSLPGATSWGRQQIDEWRKNHDR